MEKLHTHGCSEEKRNLIHGIVDVLQHENISLPFVLSLYVLLRKSIKKPVQETWTRSSQMSNLSCASGVRPKADSKQPPIYC